MDSQENLKVNVYDRKTRAILDDVVDSKIKRLWFKNYEANREIIKSHCGITDVPIVSDVICVGAGWSLDENIELLKGVDIPVLVCDKSASAVAKYVKPYAVLALNTEKTKIQEWIKDFKHEVSNQGWDMNDIWLIVPVTVDPSIFDVWSGDSIAFINPSNTCDEFCSLVTDETHILPTLRGDNVGFFSVITAVTLGARNIIMLGMNYCYKTMQEALEATNGYSYVMIHDVNDEEVFTTLDWIGTRTEFIDFCMDFLDEVKFINCSQGGILYQVGVISKVDFRAWIQQLSMMQGEGNASKRAT